MTSGSVPHLIGTGAYGRSGGPYTARVLSLVSAGTPLCVVDTETTGRIMAGSPLPLIWQLAAVRVVGGRTVSRLERYIKLGVPLPAEIARLCGVSPLITEQRGIPAAAALSDLSRFGAGALWVGHNIDRFDGPVLREAYRAAGLTLPAALVHGAERKIDTYRLAREFFPVPSAGDHYLTLEALADTFGLPHDKSRLHGAAADAELCAALLAALLKLARNARSAAD